MWIGKKFTLILCVTCHGLRNFPLLIHIPLYPFVNFQKPYELLFSELESLIKLYKNLLNNFTCHLWWLEKLSPTHTHPLISIHEFLKPYELLYFELVTHKMLNVNCIKIHSIILSVTCHGLRNFPLLIHIPSKLFVNFQNLVSYYVLS